MNCFEIDSLLKLQRMFEIKPKIIQKRLHWYSYQQLLMLVFLLLYSLLLLIDGWTLKSYNFKISFIEGIIFPMKNFLVSYVIFINLLNKICREFFWNNFLVSSKLFHTNSWTIWRHLWMSHLRPKKLSLSMQ